MAATLILLWSASAAPSADWPEALTRFGTQYRATLMALERNEPAQARTELAELKAAWEAVQALMPAEKRKDEPLTAATDTSMRLITATMMLDFGRPDVAREALAAACRNVRSLRDPARDVQTAEC